jgi:hypothetical protein
VFSPDATQPGLVRVLRGETIGEALTSIHSLLDLIEKTVVLS